MSVRARYLTGNDRPQGAVGFDLDMTLIDSRPVSERALQRLIAEHDHILDVPPLMAGYGLPLSCWLPAGSDHALFRSLQMQSIAATLPMPGALAAVEAVRDSGSRVVVVTAATTAVARAMLTTVGLAVDGIRADAWAERKVRPLREEACWAFVGDHSDDMSAARRAGAIAVGVATGLTRPTGADVELPDLTTFGSWLEAAKPTERRGSRRV